VGRRDRDPNCDAYADVGCPDQYLHTDPRKHTNRTSSHQYANTNLHPDTFSGTNTRTTSGGSG
jgi:hypothetical protein